VKFSLISATSIFALLSASVGVAQAGVQSTALTQSNLYDLVRDGITSSDGGDRTVTSQDLSISASVALETGILHWLTPSFVGPIDLTAKIPGYPTIALGAVPGTRPDDDLASSVTGSAQSDVVLKARALGTARVASLIGTVGSGPPPDDKSDSTVFVAAGKPPGFNDGGNEAGSTRVNAYAFAPSSTSTATITVAGAGNLPRQGFGGGFAGVAANSLRAGPPTLADSTPPAGVQAPATVALADTVQPTLGFKYTPVSHTARKDVTVAASFSDAITASGNLAQNVTAPAAVQTSQLQSGPGRSTIDKIQTSQLQPGSGQSGRSASGKIQTSQVQPGSATAKVQTSELQSGQDNLGRIQTSEAEARLSGLIDLSETPQSPKSGTHVDGTRTLISASVSANPSATAALYMANVVNAVRTLPAGQSVEAFEVGPSSGPRNSASPTTVSDPLHGKVMASAGALNNSLALP
jgi:hypothetical protein